MDDKRFGSLTGVESRTPSALELTDIFRPREHGGILARRGVVDVFTCLRRADEISFAGGVFVVVEAPDAATGTLLAGKGIPCSGDGRYVLPTR